MSFYAISMKQNDVLLEKLSAERANYYSYALYLSRRDEVAEDVVQNVVIRLLKNQIDFEIESNHAFLRMMVFQSFQNYKKSNRRYKLMDDSPESHTRNRGDGLFELAIMKNSPCTYEDDVQYSLTLKEIKKAAASLPKQQRAAIMNSLAGNDIGEGLGKDPSGTPRYESLKTNRRLGIQALREFFSGIENVQGA